jgi:hypothetical protein
MKAIRATCELIGILALFVLVILYPPMHILWTLIGGIALLYLFWLLLAMWWKKWLK